MTFLTGDTSSEDEEEQEEDISMEAPQEAGVEVQEKKDVSNSDNAQYDETSTDESDSEIMGEQDAIRVSRDEVCVMSRISGTIIFCLLKKSKHLLLIFRSFKMFFYSSH